MHQSRERHAEQRVQSALKLDGTERAGCGPPPEHRLVSALEQTADPALGPLRASVALGGYLLGRLDRFEAAELSGRSEALFDQLVEAGAQVVGSHEQVAPASQRPTISVVIPVLDEAANLPLLYERLSRVLPSLGTYEIIFVDDGSRDGSPDIILGLRRADPSVKLLRLSRNFGHQAALSAGLDHARGEAVVLMDADLQDPPEVIAAFFEQWRSGHDVVYAIRAKRSGNPLKRACYVAFYRVLRRMARIDIPADSGDFCLIDGRVAETIRALPERNRFLRGLRAWAGFRQVGVPCERPERYAGVPKYTWGHLLKLGLDGLLSFSTVPLRLGSYLGILTALVGMVYTLVALVAKIFVGHVPAGWTSIIAIVLVLGGVQLVLMGLLGEYLARVYEETKDRPVYVVDQAHGMSGEA